MSQPDERLSVSTLERIDDLCAGFEMALKGDEKPSIESILGEVGVGLERQVLLGELLALEVDYRRKRGEQPSVQDYSSRFPNDESVVEQALSTGQTEASSKNFVPPSLDRLGVLFPALEILELIGSGGMGAVYKARQRGLDRMVAIKILPEEVCHDMKFAMRFTREARVLAKLNHPNIVAVHEFGTSEGIYYFLMEYVDGSTLRDIIHSRHLDPQQALAIVPNLCDALQYAHDQGVVHRDIKPENILLNKQGQVKIADFGLSRLLNNDQQDHTLTGTHQVMGTLKYMAPEQMEGAHHVDHRADIYSLGVVIYEMLTGELPLGRFAAPSEKVQIDVRLDEVVLRTLEKEPQRRYQRASEVKLDVESITSHAERISTVPTKESAPANSIEQQELAARLLILRRQLMTRVSGALKPLMWGQITQILFGIAMVALGVACWAPNQSIPHRLISGLCLHIYGILMIVSSGITLGRICKVNYSKPVDSIREQLKRIGNHYLRSGILAGFVWWWMWIPLAVALGFDIVIVPTCLWPSLVIGILGFLVSLIVMFRVATGKSERATRLRRTLGGQSLARANLALDEIDLADIK